LSNAPRAEKKNFQVAERLRLGALKDEIKAEGPIQLNSEQQVSFPHMLLSSFAMTFKMGCC